MQEKYFAAGREVNIKQDYAKMGECCSPEKVSHTRRKPVKTKPAKKQVRTTRKYKNMFIHLSS